MPESHLRAADADRAAVAATLGEHMSAGRLTVEEYDERLTRVYAARTFGELAELTADLPATRAVVPAPAVRQEAVGGCGAGSWGRGIHHGAWRSWLTTAVIVLTIWLVASIGRGEAGPFWPIWVIGPWGAVLLARTVGARAVETVGGARAIGPRRG